ncbi:ATP-binding protein [Alicyclobacillus sp. SO9]|uniref:ATP-binding protein n=1 Tax=Alicyclobacillus sp. SO9 TaxID=2665646 RepID=UPI0018E87CFB|nr:ATP-binding protein [Alicyclobacillus sp. SO9]QQE78561.1 MEDS domain-containing protein [Alicyclobacillus sp. SO9]
MDRVLRGISINRDFKVENGAHILYLFQQQTSYLENLVSYVTDGLALGHIVVVVDSTKAYNQLVKRLSIQFSEENLQYVFFENNEQFYNTHEDFHAESIVKHFGQFMASLPESSHAVLTWAHVIWRKQPDILTKIDEFEQIADKSVKGQRLVSVCAYDGGEMDANLLVKLQRSHDYFMTDKELIRSPLYASSRAKFPSLSVQSKIESELDLYKSKLDFAHVVSHEVRNPLTIIDGYAKMIRTDEHNLSPDSINKLDAIGYYVDVIDQELTNIIETERVLSEELYMKLEPIEPLGTVHHVIELMKVKSIVQNIDFHWTVDAHEQHLMLANPMGLRLILSNVISNAIKYTETGGRVEFDTSINNNQIRFTVRDNGVGMSVQQLNRLYQKYAKLNDSESGQGIGLYVVKNLTNRFNGQIIFTSEVGLGTTVTIDFPLLHRKDSS